MGSQAHRGCRGCLGSVVHLEAERRRRRCRRLVLGGRRGQAVQVVQADQAALPVLVDHWDLLAAHSDGNGAAMPGEAEQQVADEEGLIVTAATVTRGEDGNRDTAAAEAPVAVDNQQGMAEAALVDMDSRHRAASSRTRRRTGHQAMVQERATAPREGAVSSKDSEASREDTDDKAGRAGREVDTADREDMGGDETRQEAETQYALQYGTKKRECRQSSARSRARRGAGVSCYSERWVCGRDACVSTQLTIFGIPFWMG